MHEVMVEGTRVAVHASGAGEPVVLLHSSAFSAIQWRSLRAGLESDFRVTAPDFFGCGSSEPWPGHRPITLADYVRLVAAVVDEGRPVHLVGHSFGGAVALQFALQWPHLVRSLTLIEPVLFHILREGGASDRMALREASSLAYVVRDGLASGHRAAAMAHFVDYWNGDGAWARLDDTRRAGLCTACVTLALDFHATLTEQTMLSAYGRLMLPTLLLEGGRSPAPVRRITAKLADVLPGARTETFADAGHMLPLTHGPQVLAMITRQLQDTFEPMAAAA
jgi:pimeloyl-ACP methyl ester carboxylesterase